MAAAPDPGDPVALTQALIRCESVTPKDAGALSLLETVLTGLGFRCRRLAFGEGEARVDNLYAEIGQGRPHLMFAGHVDVVPEGDRSAWTHDPFAGEVTEGALWGRGAADMKGAVAAFAAAAAGYLKSRGGPPGGTLSILLTGDEEGVAVNGTRKLVEWLQSRGTAVEHCLLGEPTSAAQLGDTIKVGRRGSLTADITLKGRQGHVAYPDKADNPVHRLLPVLARLTEQRLDAGTDVFQPSSLQITTVDVGNPTPNVIPGEVGARLNIRFNDRHTSESLLQWLESELSAAGEGLSVDYHVSGEAFRTPAGPFSDLVSDAAQSITGLEPAPSTGGGTSDARFIKDLCPVVELGLVGATMHQVDEHVPVADIRTLTEIYAAILNQYFEAGL